MAPTPSADGRSVAQADRRRSCFVSWQWQAIVTRSSKTSMFSIGSTFLKRTGLRGGRSSATRCGTKFAGALIDPTALLSAGRSWYPFRRPPVDNLLLSLWAAWHRPSTCYVRARYPAQDGQNPHADYPCRLPPFRRDDTEYAAPTRYRDRQGCRGGCR